VAAQVLADELRKRDIMVLEEFKGLGRRSSRALKAGFPHADPVFDVSHGDLPSSRSSHQGLLEENRNAKKEAGGAVRRRVFALEAPCGWDLGAEIAPEGWRGLDRVRHVAYHSEDDRIPMRACRDGR
jgi:hypothetical protein